MAARTFRKNKQQQSRVFFDVIFDVYTHVDNRERARASDWKQKRTNFVGTKTWTKQLWDNRVFKIQRRDGNENVHKNNRFN